MKNDLRPSKLARLRAGGRPRVLDLFSGCGGLSLGFHRSGCEIVAGVEKDPHAARSHAWNFHRDETEAWFELHARSRDITVLPARKLMDSIGRPEPRDAVDFLVGGPPCPAFTRVGRAKLREVHQHPQAFKKDPRAKLYLPYLQYVRDLQPVALIMENVPDVLNFGGHNLAEEICEVLEEIGYACAYTLLNASLYGVPQMRERFILVAWCSGVEGFEFPRPTRHVDFPPGYQGARDVALKHINADDMFKRTRYVSPPLSASNLPPAVSVREAIGDLPRITGHLTGEIKRGARRFDRAVPLAGGAPPTDYAKQMLAWPGFESSGRLWDHQIRSLSDRDYRLFRAMKPGDDYPKAHALATRLYLEELQRQGLEEGTPPAEALKPSYVPPYDVGKFPNKWRKMEPDAPARTLMAHLGKDSYSHIHFDSDQARVISIREAARLQSFPDGFAFCGTMNPALRQIGNAVPPLLALALAESLRCAVGASGNLDLAVTA